MNYSQYLQQGGGIQDQVAALVQAAMGGNQQATDQINQIMQAAQQGDLKAQQLAQLIQQITQQLQSQTEEETAEAYKKGGKVKKCACGSKTPKKEKGGDVKKCQLGAKVTPKAKTKVPGVITWQVNGPLFEQSVAYYKPGTNLIDSVANNFLDENGQMYRYLTNFADAPKGQVPYEELKQIDSNGNIGPAEQLERNWILPKAKTWSLPAHWNIDGNTSNGLRLIKSEAKGGKCPCQLKRIGGKLVEVDGCTGMPVKKNK